MATRRTTKKATPVQDAAAAKIIDPGWSWDDKLPLAQAKQIGNTIYVSGQVAFNSQGKLVGKGNMKTQTRQVFRNIKAVLAAAGAKMEHVIKINTYITDGSKFMDMLEARGEIFGNNPPASTAVVVAGLAFPGLLIEVEAIAVKP
jgi:reactive intermediate/imine deaminase